MDLIVTLVGEFIWTTCCSIVNFCLGSGVSATAVFVSFLGGILASAFYKYTISREELFSDDTIATPTDDDDDDDRSTPATRLIMNPSIISPSSFVRTTNSIDVYADENTSDNEQTYINLLNDTADYSDEEIEMKQLDNNNMTTADLQDQLRMYELSTDDENELELP